MRCHKRLKSRKNQQALAVLPVFRTVVHAYVASVLVQTAQSGACNTVHPLQQRLGRWLLLARDALQSDDIPLTHQVLAQLLGVRRAGVTESLILLRKEGLIEMMRGRLVIRDAFRLAQSSCPCWRLIKREYERQLVSTEAGDIGALPTQITRERTASDHFLLRQKTV
ncbi:Crp/Fnr family transcriptional regulator [Bradyrhizobium sp. CCGUVB23]|uniref:Crp/Fnr family transcriptional regulator n=1 Tax=Bradyrhizobium sp. CCGUVB23 TaxID=2949630 RepID=UPI0020B1D1FD|nr:helix-turn-helix domain-containing protein [Bradyrhizobium sp. CCGUVB23]MCP3459775.1 helix-turn-helix domain-containing protein [Bradyrhizobium sp. CCGUVB23]